MERACPPTALQNELKKLDSPALLLISQEVYLIYGFFELEQLAPLPRPVPAHAHSMRNA